MLVSVAQSLQWSPPPSRLWQLESPPHPLVPPVPVLVLEQLPPLQVALLVLGQSELLTHSLYKRQW